MGKSRSATILAAYLMASRRISPDLAVGLIKRSRRIVEPNSGFAEQLELYHEMEYAVVVEDHPIYQRWIYQQDVKLSNAAGRAPERVHFRDAEAEIGKITQADEGEAPAEIELRCKKCRYVCFLCWIRSTLITCCDRRTLATTASLTPHLPKPTQPPMPHVPRQQCAHHFLEPLLWMKPELSKGEVSGKLECPKCKCKVGTYAWQGLRCSCGDWIVPGISVARGKVDEIRVRL